MGSSKSKIEPEQEQFQVPYIEEKSIKIQQVCLSVETLIIITLILVIVWLIYYKRL
jgi:hypothetical protein